MIPFNKQQHIENLLRAGHLISPQLLDKIEKEGFAEVFESHAVLQEKNNQLPVISHTTPAPQPTHTPPSVRVLFSYSEKSQKRDVQDFVDYYTARYRLIEHLLQQRPEMTHLRSISSLHHTPGEKTSIIGMVYEKKFTKNNNIILSIEDPSGRINVIVNHNKPDVFSSAADIVHDEVIGVTGVGKENVFFANNIIFPDLPSKNQLKKSPHPGYAVFLSDIHVGSRLFLHDAFDRFLQWIRGEAGTAEQRSIAKAVKYVFIAGDVVDGVGIYPSQEQELSIPDIYQQYEECTRLFSKIPSHIKLIIAPGNHDATRLSEPQPPFSEFARALFSLPNATILSNPCVVSIDSSPDFSGLLVLMYHGYSFDYYVANVDSIRQQGGYDRADLIMKFLLKRRHLAPAHTSTLYIPDKNTDPLFITTPPDIFVTGHVHRTSVSHYKDTTLISGSCWQSLTPFQARMGHRPQPARVPVVDLHTRNVRILRFGQT